MRRTRTLAIALALAATSLVASGCIIGPSTNSDGTITIDNASSYVLTEVRVTAIDSSSWGPNLLGGDVLYPDEQLTVSVLCDRYDVLISDERGRDCVLSDVDLCFSDQRWTIDNSTLRYCDF